MAGIATILGGVAAAVSATGGIISLGQAAKQRKAQERAERESERLMQQARQNLQTKFYEQLQVPTEAYDRQFRESTAQQKQSLQALQESDPRTLAAGVGKVGAVGVAENQKIREDMAERMFQLQQIKAKEMRDINDALVSLDAGESRTQELRAREARKLAKGATESGFASLASGLGGVAEQIPLYLKSREDRKLSKITGSEDLRPGSKLYNDQIAYRQQQAQMNLRNQMDPIIQNNLIDMQERLNLFTNVVPDARQLYPDYQSPLGITPVKNVQRQINESF
tara:strand:+ start:518 stop:1360 length:843 start_codon:yes stop_codon:yes gene_type:complete